MKSFSLRKSIISAAVLTSLSVGQVMAQQETKEQSTQTFSETLLSLQPTINKGIKNAYKLAKKSIGPIAALYLFMKYISPLSKDCFGQENNQITIKSIDKFKEISSIHEKLDCFYEAGFHTHTTVAKMHASNSKSLPVKVAEKILDTILSVFVLDAYIKPPLKVVQEKIQSYVEKTEEQLGLA